MPIPETTERNIHKIADQIKAQEGHPQSTEVAKDLATLQMRQISTPEKQAALTTVKTALRVFRTNENGNSEEAAKATALLKQTYLLFHQAEKK
ncbi:hypothetical protein [Candidatus Protochlamydia phocaeensis]|uniref:hypothetical protein n=1 Tax=Candidatus Protochlamydia phocaeensis TaxID=1414722 RepID=UPI0008384B77|nr:hypothetical protein [Candidatus Protochlamydia phocaeensis]